MIPTAWSRAPLGARCGARLADAIARSTGIACVALSVAVLTGCGSAGSSDAASGSHPRTARTATHPLQHKPDHPGAPSSADMVAAVGSDKAGVPVDVRFALRERPEVGKPVELDVQVTPSAPVGKLVMSFHPEDGLSIQAGGSARESDRPEPGVALSRALTIVAQRDGIFYVSATVLVDNGAESVARTFTIPIIAGAGTS